MTTQHEHNKNRSTIKKQHHFSIRKLSGGIASIAIGATLFLGAGQTANAMEDKVDTVNEAAATTEDSQSEPVAADDASAAETAEAPAAENVDNETESNDGVTEEIQGSDATDSTDVKADDANANSVSVDDSTADDGTSSEEESEAKEEPDTTDPSKETQVFPGDETLESAVGSDGAADNATTEATTDKEESAVSEENEAHDFGFIVKKEAEDAKSVMDDYLEHPSKVSHENGKTYVNFTLLNPNWWKMFELYNGDEKLNMTTLEENDDKRVVKVEVPSGVSELTSKVHIVVPFINYDNKYTTRVIFDEAVPEEPKAEPETPKAETPKAETPREDKVPADKDEDIVSADNEGQDFGFVVKKEQKDATSVSDLYFEHPAKIIHKNGKTFVNFTLKRPEFWKKFELYNGDEKLNTTIIEDTEEQRMVQVEVPTGVSTLISKLHLYIPYGDTYDYDLTTRVVFDKAIPDASQVVPEVPKADAEAPKTEPESPKVDAETPKADQDQTSKLREDVKNKEIHNKQVDGEKRPINFKVINPKDNSEIFYYAAMIKDPANIVFDGDQPILELRVDAPSTWVEFDLFDGDKKLDYDVVSFDPENEVATIRVKVNENTKELKVKGTSLIFGKKSEHELGHIVFDKPITKDASNYATADDYKKQKDREKYDKAVTLEDKVRELEKLIDKVSDDEKPQLQEVLKGLKDKLAKELETAVTEFEKAPVTNVNTSKAKDRDFKVLHSSKEDQSHMDFEVEHPAKLVEYNGKKMLAITLKHDSMWKDFQVEGEDGYKRPITISKDSEKDTRTILFPVVEGKDFYNAIIKIHLITPHIEYEGSYHVRIKDLGDAAETAAPEPTPEPTPAPSPEPTPSPAPDNKQEPTKDQPSIATPDQKQEPAKDQPSTATPDQKPAPTTDQKQEPTKDQQPTVKPDQKAEPVVNVSTKPTTEPVVNVSTKPTTEPAKDKVEATKLEPNKEKAETESTKQELSKDKATTEQPTEQAKKQENKNELPNTGEFDNTQYALFGSLIAGLGSLFFIGRRKTKNSK
ncbi:NEAT domain-containing protein [Mammaliicoccus sciuri]|uniref:NEAT domain-containing protein n=1 Tax=Mammaliicoccus sciuri TaxID=1296 RepID=UPI001E470D24|nr:NEAT domain-containing protein [Mammaliicoccus sciuri]MCD3220373.1 NEAT domain-containing protein [Mammaliicoccus sciuri]MCJ0909733.1 NEAT domain-containing protein [Mammaliicoccus sciuri]MEB6118896.1 NEAT domain-containing protein [Mammaliicoccus sciuri]